MEDGLYHLFITYTMGHMTIAALLTDQHPYITFFEELIQWPQLGELQKI